MSIPRVDCLSDCVADCTVSDCLRERCDSQSLSGLHHQNTRMNYRVYTILLVGGDILHHCSNLIVANLTDDRYALFTDNIQV